MNPPRNPTDINTLMWPFAVFAIHPVQYSAALTGRIYDSESLHQVPNGAILENNDVFCQANKYIN